MNDELQHLIDAIEDLDVDDYRDLMEKYSSSVNDLRDSGNTTNWLATVYDRDECPIYRWVIENRTESEAEKEVHNEVLKDEHAADWTMREYTPSEQITEARDIIRHLLDKYEEYSTKETIIGAEYTHDDMVAQADDWLKLVDRE